MSLRLLRPGLVATLLFSLAVVPRLLLGPLVSVKPGGSGPPARPVNEVLPPTVPDSVIAGVVARTPFRARRRPALTAFEPNRTAEAGPPVAAPVPKPALVLTGIIWEQEPVAVIEGLPGSNGPRVVRARETVGPLRVRRIEREQVLVSGLDTTWTL